MSATADDSIKPVNSTTPELRRLTNEAYTIGWICTSMNDLAAARAVMDEVHSRLPQHPADKNDYILGSVNGHNIVVTSLSTAQAGTIAAAVAAARIMSSFSRIKYIFMVGTGSGVPTGDRGYYIRLGDVVVGTPSPNATVIQYDFAKITPKHDTVLRHGSMSPDPPPEILAAVRNYRTEYMQNSSDRLLGHVKRLSDKIYGLWVYPGAQYDRLFKSDYDHEGNNSCDHCDENQELRRLGRGDMDIVVHYGSIGSANQLIRNAKVRDRLGNEYGVLCLDTESAGVMKDFPCLVIRGITEYADSHANRLWEKYASITAAAYTADLLRFMSRATHIIIGEQTDSNHWRSATGTDFFPHVESRHSRSDSILTPEPSTSFQSLTLDSNETVGSSVSSALSEEYLRMSHKSIPRQETAASSRQDSDNFSFFDIEDATEGNYAPTDEWIRKLKRTTHKVLELRRRKNDKRVKIAILDTGVDATHPLIKEHEERIRDFQSWTDSDIANEDINGHGTHATHLLLDVAPNADVYIARITEGSGSELDMAQRVAKAIKHAATVWEVDIITMSFGFPDSIEEIDNAIMMAFVKGVIILAAASNEGANSSTPIAYPARHHLVICIHSTDGHGTGSRFTPPPQPNEVNFGIIGEAVRSAWPRNLQKGLEQRKSGTSVATPIAAGVAALVLEFIRQRPALGDGPRLNYNAMVRVLKMMVIKVSNGYDYLRPWALFDRVESRESIASDIKKLLLTR